MTVILSTENREKTEKKLKVADIDKDDVKVILWKMKESECISLGENNAWEKVKANVIFLGENHYQEKVKVNANILLHNVG